MSAAMSGIRMREASINLRNLAYCFPCPGCGDLISLPQLSPLGGAFASQYQCTDLWPILFLCTRFAQIGEVRQETIHPGPDALIHKPDIPSSLWEIDCECSLENCRKRHTIYTLDLRDADPVAVSRMFLSINPEVACLGGHSAKLHRQHVTAYRVAA
jgi:hypothetical protein